MHPLPCLHACLYLNKKKNLTPACRCNERTTAGCEMGSGRCICKPQFSGENCDRCAGGYYYYPQCICEFCLFFITYGTAFPLHMALITDSVWQGVEISPPVFHILSFFFLSVFCPVLRLTDINISSRTVSTGSPRTDNTISVFLEGVFMFYFSWI